MTEKLRRLYGMSTSEIAHRLREQFRRGADKLRFHTQLGLGDDPELEELVRCHGSSLKDYLQSGPARRFYPSSQSREVIAKFFKEQYPEWLDRTVREARVLCEHRINL